MSGDTIRIALLKHTCAILVGGRKSRIFDKKSRLLYFRTNCKTSQTGCVHFKHPTTVNQLIKYLPLLERLFVYFYPVHS